MKCRICSGKSKIFRKLETISDAMSIDVQFVTLNF